MEQGAYHEAGHALMFKTFGLEVRLVTVGASHPDFPFGRTQVATPDLTLGRKCGCLAGPLAEAIFTWRQAAADPPAFEQHCLKALRLSPQDVRTALAVSLNNPDVRESLGQAGGHAIELLYGGWEAVCRLAERLLEVGSIDGAELGQFGILTTDGTVSPLAAVWDEEWPNQVLGDQPLGPLPGSLGPPS